MDAQCQREFEEHAQRVIEASQAYADAIAAVLDRGGVCGLNRALATSDGRWIAIELDLESTSVMFHLVDDPAEAV